MAEPLLECVPNVSEGRDPAVVEAIARAFTSAGATRLDVESDHDHHRSVITVAGSHREVVDGAVAGVRAAVRLIDLNDHRGAHPRMGAADVVPFVPLEGATMAHAVAAAEEAAERIARELSVPTYLYGEAARRPERRDLAKVREGQFEGIREAIVSDPARAPDFGPSAVHPTAGASAVGARFFLVAFNVNLDTRDLAVAKRIAKEVRERDGGLPGVKALGFDLPQKEWVQVSMNLVDFRRTSPVQAFDAVASRAEALGVRVAGSELVGLIPRAACPPDFPSRVRLLAFDPDQVVETRLEKRRGRPS
ncbi:MAG: glutamate formimidoyltransferase [Planctomycetes bacterium]|nr:glutamate formimidoyltransferase [Planctomycetota bacterium]